MQIAQKEEGIWSSLAALGARALPKVLLITTSEITKVLPGLATGALRSLGSFGMDKILGLGVQT